MSNHDRSADDDDRAHLAGIESGAGCVEIWERLSERRSGDDACATCDD